jgi:hypothetical protein
LNKLKKLDEKSSHSGIVSDRKYYIPKVELQSPPEKKELKNIK